MKINNKKLIIKDELQLINHKHFKNMINNQDNTESEFEKDNLQKAIS